MTQILDPVHPTPIPGLETTQLAGRIGAVISGIRLSGELDESLVARIRTALHRHKVIFFRAQDHLDADGQVAFARRLGPLTAAHPTVPGLDGNDRVLDLDYRKGQRADHWHTDVTFTDRPPLASVLRAIDVPAQGGDTVWANTVAAYDELPDELRDLADRLWAVHTNQYDYVRPDATEAELRRNEVFQSTVYETEHPFVRVHPETGERAILLGGFARHVVGVTAKQDSEALIRLFQDHVTRLENTVRWHWSPGDVAIWDNRATQHRVIHDFGDQPRRLHRVTVAGDVPVGVDGRRSVARTGDAATYSPDG